jgi:hypothetical protein
MAIHMTREQIETYLDRKYKGRYVTFTTIKNREVTDKIHRIAAEPYPDSNEIRIIFILGHERYECDAIYFRENIKIHGNPQRADT